MSKNLEETVRLQSEKREEWIREIRGVRLQGIAMSSLTSYCFAFCSSLFNLHFTGSSRSKQQQSKQGSVATGLEQGSCLVFAQLAARDSFGHQPIAVCIAIIRAPVFNLHL